MEPALRHECQRLIKVGSAASSGKGVDGNDILPRKAVRRYIVLCFMRRRRRAQRKNGGGLS